MIEPVTIKDIARRLVLRVIEAEVGNAAEQKARVLIAREHGHLTDAEAQDWLSILDIKAA